MIGGDMYRGYLLIILLLLCHTTFSSATPRWSVFHHNDGTIDLLFDNIPALSGGCPAIKLPSSSNQITTYCSPGTMTSTTDQPLNGSDPKMGSYTDFPISYTSTSSKLPPNTIITFRAYSPPSSIIHVLLTIPSGVDTNFISPLYKARWSIGAGLMTRVLDIPMDNDVQSFYTSVAPAVTGTSMFATSFYDEKSKKGMVLGFLEHDTFKSGFEYGYEHVNMVAGINGLLTTRDVAPHGIVFNMTKAPLLSISMHDDWRDGMEMFASMQKENDGKPVDLPKGVGTKPFSGWNSWAMGPGGLGQPNASVMMAAVDILAETNISQQIVTRDAVYNMNDSATYEWIAAARSKGQLVGTYSSDVIWWHGSEDQTTVDCSGPSTCNVSTDDNCWNVNDIVLKTKKGKWIRSVFAILSNGPQHVRDVTHPSWVCFVEFHLQREVNKFGYNLIKEDFLNLAAYEGEHWNTSIASTGMMAYNYALRIMAEKVDQRAILDYGISLVLPVGPSGHARHSGCEQMYGGVMYGMNQYAGGWWLNSLYNWQDPDLVTFQGDYWFRPELANWTKFFSMDAKSRVAKAVVYGGVFKNGDVLSNATNAALVQKYMGNQRVNEMWQVAQAGDPSSFFRPISWGKGIFVPPSTFVRKKNGDVGVFNYDGIQINVVVDLNEVFGSSISSKDNVTCVEVWEETSVKVDMLNFELHLVLQARTSMLISCRIRPSISTFNLQQKHLKKRVV